MASVTSRLTAEDRDQSAPELYARFEYGTTLSYYRQMTGPGLNAGPITAQARTVTAWHQGMTGIRKDFRNYSVSIKM